MEDKIDAKTLAEMNDAGVPYSDIANKFGITIGKVAGAIRRYRQKTGNKYEGGQREKTEYEQGDDFINVICASRRILSKEEIISQFNVDLSEWEVSRYKVKTSEGYRKDRSVRWVVQDGKVLTGDVNDTGKMLVVPLYHIEVSFTKKKKIVDAKQSIDALKEDARKFAPVYHPIKYAQDGEYLFEIDMQDIHFGRLAWQEESGENYDIKIARTAVESSLLKLIGFSKLHKIERILFPLGNDFFNVDNKFNTTTRGTPQQEDTRWQKTFRLGREMCVWMIDTCAQIAPVDVLIVPGNHDEQRAFYMGDALECWYHNCGDVHINNEAAKRKYYSYGSVLLGFTHGYDEKLERLPLLMALDQPILWAGSKFREWHTGDKHHKKDLRPVADEGSGMVVRIMRSLAAYDAWTFDKGYRSVRASEAFLWHKANGLIAQYTAMPDV